MSSPAIAADAGRHASDRRWLVAWIGAALVLRLFGHLDSGLWFDEIWMLVESIRVPFGTVLTTFESDNNHPLYTVLAWLSVHGLGESAWTLRLPAVLFGAASVGMMWAFARRVAPRAEAVLATALMLVSYHHVWFSQNARGYTMLLFWTLAATHLLLRVLDNAGPRAWIAYGICLALATYTHASAVLVALAHGAVVTAVFSSRARRATREGPGSRGARDAWKGLFLGGVVSVALHAAILREMFAFFVGGGGEVGAEAAGSGGSDSGRAPEEAPALAVSEWNSFLWTLRAVVESLGVSAPIGFAALAAAAMLGATGTWVVWRRDWRLAALYLVPGLLVVATTFGLGRSLRPRFLFHLSGFALLVGVAGVFAVCRWAARRATASAAAGGRAERWLAWGAGALIVLASLVLLPRAYTLPKQDFEGALDYVSGARRPGEVVATTGLTTLPYRDYFETGFEEVRTAADLDRLVAGSEAVYVLHTLPIFLESTDAQLASRIASGEEVARFRGSLGGGDVVVYRFQGVP